MRFEVEATDDELVAKADAVLDCVRDLQAAARARTREAEPLAKAVRLSIKAHPELALTQLRRIWVAGYRRQMQAMIAEMATYLDGLPPGP